jgi:hypothetical protein
MYYTVTPAFAVRCRDSYPNQHLFCHPWCANMHTRKTRRTLSTDLDHRWRTYEPKYRRLGVPENLMQSLKKAHRDLDDAKYEELKSIRKPGAIGFEDHNPYLRAAGRRNEGGGVDESDWIEIR